MRAARQNCRAIFPLSATHYMEVVKIRSPKQREQIAKLMEELSGLTCLTSPMNLMFGELNAALDRQLGVQTPLPPFSIVGKGVGFALGFPLEIDHETEMRILSGPSDEELPDLKARGWDVDSFMASIEKRASMHQAFSDSLDAHWRKGRMRDVVSSRNLLSEMELIALALLRRDISFEEAFPLHADELIQGRLLARAMPSLETAVQLQCRIYSQPQSKWLPNTVFDIDALSVAVPYCDVVLPDKEFAHAIVASKLNKTMGTQIMTDLRSLGSYLMEL